MPGADVLPDVGEWLPADDPRVPAWLKPFGGDVLVVLDDDVYVAGVGLKRHDEHGQEISVGTEEAARGRGLARRLVAQAARRPAGGAASSRRTCTTRPTSPPAKVADAAGFPDRGWTVLGMSGPREPPRPRATTARPGTVTHGRLLTPAEAGSPSGRWHAP